MLMLSCQVFAVEVDSPESTVEVRISLDADGKPYYIVRDGKEADRQESPYDYVSEERVLDKTTLELNLAAGGGTAIRFRPIPEAGQ